MPKRIPSPAASLRHPVSGWQLYFIVFCILSVESTALVLLKTYAMSLTSAYFAAGIAVYMAVPVLLSWSFRYEGMGVVNVLWSAFSVMVAFLCGFLIFGEQVSLIEICGAALVLIGIAILRLPAAKKVRGGRCMHVTFAELFHTR